MNCVVGKNRHTIQPPKVEFSSTLASISDKSVKGIVCICESVSDGSVLSERCSERIIYETRHLGYLLLGNYIPLHHRRVFIKASVKTSGNAKGKNAGPPEP
jgi:hypothetical protein